MRLLGGSFAAAAVNPSVQPEGAAARAWKQRRTVHATEELPAVAEPGLAMGRYRLGARLGAGGFGTVYAARDERLGRPVAVKVIPADGPAPERAQREARAVARLDHDAIVALFDAGEEDGCRYLVSELVEGRTLAQLEAAGELSDRDVLRIGLALADALAHAHERGVIHRDVKPQNVIVPDAPSSRRGAAKLTDFGVAHLAGEEALTLTGDVVGTLAYMAPEQAAGRAVDERADLYSLGLVLYEALAGANPVRGGSPTRDRAPDRHRAAAAARRARADLPARAVRGARPRDPARPRAARRARRPVRRARRRAAARSSDDGGLIAPHPLERRIPALPPAIGRLVAPAAAGAARVRRARRARRPSPRCRRRSPRSPPARSSRCCRAPAGCSPRRRRSRCSRSGPRRGPARRVLLLALALAPPLLLRADGRAWSLPAAAPALGLLGLAGAYPALAGRAPRWSARAALGALGAWWLVLAEPLLERALVFGAGARHARRARASTARPASPRAT